MCILVTAYLHLNCRSTTRQTLRDTRELRPVVGRDKYISGVTAISRARRQVAGAHWRVGVRCWAHTRVHCLPLIADSVRARPAVVDISDKYPR